MHKNRHRHATDVALERRKKKERKRRERKRWTFCWKRKQIAEFCSRVNPPLLLISICCCQPLPQSGASAAVLEWGRASPVSHKHTQIIYMLYSSKASLPQLHRDLLLILASNIAFQRVSSNLCKLPRMWLIFQIQLLTYYWDGEEPRETLLPSPLYNGMHYCISVYKAC